MKCITDSIALEEILKRRLKRSNWNRLHIRKVPLWKFLWGVQWNSRWFTWSFRNWRWSLFSRPSTPIWLSGQTHFWTGASLCRLLIPLSMWRHLYIRSLPASSSRHSHCYNLKPQHALILGLWNSVLQTLQFQWNFLKDFNFKFKFSMNWRLQCKHFNDLTGFIHFQSIKISWLFHDFYEPFSKF